jgi:hypothetical protein
MEEGATELARYNWPLTHRLLCWGTPQTTLTVGIMFFRAPRSIVGVALADMERRPLGLRDIPQRACEP